MVTIRNIAENVGVSPSTVSRALRGSPKISAERTAQIRAAATRMGYEESTLASKPKGNNRATMLLLVPDIENQFFAGIVKAAQARARELGYATVLADFDEDALMESRLLEQNLHQTHGAVICSSRLSDEELSQLQGTFVLVNREHAEHYSVTADDRDGIQQALEHLYALGHRHIAYAAGPATSWSGGVRRNALKANHENLPGVTITELGNFAPNSAGGMRAADVLLTTQASAVVTHNDLMALGLMNRLNQRGVTIPTAMSVVGYDDTALATLADPALTTIAVPNHRMGRTAVDVLASLIEGKTPPERTTSLVSELVIRRSCTTIKE